jgi:hypothetical protein
MEVEACSVLNDIAVNVIWLLPQRHTTFIVIMVLSPETRFYESGAPRELATIRHPEYVCMCVGGMKIVRLSSFRAEIHYRYLDIFITYFVFSVTICNICIASENLEAVRILGSDESCARRSSALNSFRCSVDVLAGKWISSSSLHSLFFRKKDAASLIHCRHYWHSGRSKKQD